MTEQPRPDDLLEDLVFECLGADDVDAALRDIGSRHPDLATRVGEVVDGLRAHEMLDGAGTPAAIPERLGGFRLLERLGAGGMGIVYLAVDERLGRRVAVKLIRPDQLYFPGSRARFEREVTAVARLQHPGIVAVHSFGEEQGIPYFSMEYVAGRSLDGVLGRLRGRPVTTLTGADLVGRRCPGSEASWVVAVLTLVRGVARALQHAHERGVLHRDVKPSNILIDRQGVARLLDFGLARLEDAQQLTAPQAELGSLPYMTPEQLAGSGGEPGPEQDVYALGVTLYEMLALQSPFLAGTAEATRRRILDADCAPLRRLNPEVTRELETVCAVAMERQPERRYATAAAFADEIDRLLGHRPIVARRANSLLRAWRWTQRHPALAVAGVFGVLSVAALVGFVFYERGAAREAQRLEREAQARSYIAGIVAAGARVEAGHAAAVRQSLAHCPPALRGFEWYYLSALVDRSLATLRGHTDVVLDVTFDGSGERFASASRDGTVRLWTRHEPMAAAVFEGHEDWVTGVRFDPPRGRLLSGSRDGTIRAWNPLTATGQVWIEQSAKISCLDVDVARERLAIGDEDGAVHLFDLRSGAPVWHFAVAATGTRARGMPPTPCFDVAFDPASGRLLATAGRTILCWDQPGSATEPRRIGERPAGSPPVVGHEDWIDALAIAPSGDTLVSCDLGGWICRWRLASGEALDLPRAYRRGSIHAASYTPDGGALLVGGRGELTVLAPDASETLDAMLGHEGMIRTLALSPEGRIAVTGANDGELKLWPVPAPGDELDPARLRHRATVRAAAFDAAGALVYTGDSSGRLRVWQRADGAVLHDLGVGRGSIRSMAVHPSGSPVLAAVGDRLLRLALPSEVSEPLEAGTGCVAVAFAPAGDRFFTLNARGEVAVWKHGAAAPSRSTDALGGGDFGSSALVISPDGRWLATTADGAVHLIDADTLATSRLGSHERQSVVCVFHPRQPLLISAGFDHRVRFWPLSGGTPVRSDLVWDDELISAVAVPPDGSRLLTGAMSGRLQLWDLATGERLIELRGHDRGVLAAQFSADGSALVTGSWDRTARVWEGGAGARDR